MNRLRWARRPFDCTQMARLQTWQHRHLYHLESKYGSFAEPVEATEAQKWQVEMRRKVRDREALQWLETAQGKWTLSFYRDNKRVIAAETQLHDNSLGSWLFFKTKAGALWALVYQKRFDPKVESTMCQACGDGTETVEHLALCSECLLLLSVMDQRQPHPEMTLSDTLWFTLIPGANSADTGEAEGARIGTPRQPRWMQQTLQCLLWQGLPAQCVERTKARLERWWQVAK